MFYTQGQQVAAMFCTREEQVAAMFCTQGQQVTTVFCTWDRTSACCCVQMQRLAASHTYHATPSGTGYAPKVYRSPSLVTTRVWVSPQLTSLTLILPVKKLTGLGMKVSSQSPWPRRPKSAACAHSHQAEAGKQPYRSARITPRPGVK